MHKIKNKFEVFSFVDRRIFSSNNYNLSSPESINKNILKSNLKKMPRNKQLIQIGQWTNKNQTINKLKSIKINQEKIG